MHDIPRSREEHVRNEGGEQQIEDPEAPVDDRQQTESDESDESDEAPSSAKTRAGSNVPNAAGTGGDDTHE